MRRAIGLLTAVLLVHGSVLKGWTRCELGAPAAAEPAMDHGAMGHRAMNPAAHHNGPDDEGRQVPADRGDDASSSSCGLMAVCGSAVVVSAGIAAPPGPVEAQVAPAPAPSPRSFVTAPEPPPPRG